MKKLYILAVMLISGLVNAQEWVEIGERNDGSIFYMQEKYSKVFASDNRKVWTKSTNDVIETLNKKKINNGYMLMLNEYNCDGNMIMLHQIIYYNSNGDIVEKYEPESYEKDWSDVVPGSIGEIMMEFACSL